MGLMDYLSTTPAVTEPVNKLTGVTAPPSSASDDKVALPDFEKAKPQETPQSTEIDYSKLIREKGYYGAFLSLNKKPDFEAEEKRTRRARELALLGDVANLGGQAFASAMGARRFTPINSQVPQYNERLQRLRDAKRDYDADFNNKSLSMIFRDYEQKRADDTLKSQATAKQVAADLKLKRDLALKQIDQAFQAGMLDVKGKQALEMQAAQAKTGKELETIKHKHRLGEIGAQNKAASDRKANDKQDYGSFHFITQQGRKSREFNLNKDADVLHMYREGVRGGIYPPLDTDGGMQDMDVKKIRNYLLYQLGSQNPTKSIEEMESVPTSKGTGYSDSNTGKGRGY